MYKVDSPIISVLYQRMRKLGATDLLGTTSAIVYLVNRSKVLGIRLAVMAEIIWIKSQQQHRLNCPFPHSFLWILAPPLLSAVIYGRKAKAEQWDDLAVFFARLRVRGQ